MRQTHTPLTLGEIVVIRKAYAWTMRHFPRLEEEAIWEEGVALHALLRDHGYQPYRLKRDDYPFWRIDCRSYRLQIDLRSDPEEGEVICMYNSDLADCPPSTYTVREVRNDLGIGEWAEQMLAALTANSHLLPLLTLTQLWITYAHDLEGIVAALQPTLACPDPLWFHRGKPQRDEEGGAEQ